MTAKVICFKHKSDSCECVARPSALEYKAKTDGFLTRKQALEIYYAAQAFKENVAYRADAMKILVHNYLSVADALIERSDHLRDALQRAGFGGDSEAKGS